MLYQMQVPSPIGGITLVSDEKALLGVWMDGQKYFAATLKQPPQENSEVPVLRQTAAWLADYFAGKRPSPAAIPMAPQGSEFRQAVWQLLRQIPYGQTTTYGALAKQLEKQTGRRASAQAVGGAVGHNPISVLVPCHRVVGADGSLTGYAGGLEKKIKLLQLEGVNMAALYVPKKGTAL